MTSGPAGGDARLGETGLERADALLGAGHYAPAGIVDRGQIDVVGKVLGDRLRAEGDQTITPRGAVCINQARIATTLMAVGRSNTPAMVAAAYSPMLCPGHRGRRMP